MVAEYNNNQRIGVDKIKEKQAAVASLAQAQVALEGEQLQEMLESFNKVQSSNNSRGFYDGCTIQKLPGGIDKLIIYVTDNFLLLNKTEKQLFVEQNFKLWSGMASARKININYDHFEVEMLRKGTIKRLATWDSVFGVSIK